MRVLMPLIKGEGKDHSTWNPYCYTLTNAISDSHHDFSFSFNLDLFETDDIFTYDILHIMWPNTFFCINFEAFKQRIETIKRHGIIIISTCHNFTPHYQDESYYKQYYITVYRNSDCIIHLGQYSKEIFQKKYPSTLHLLIPHHIYDTVYTNTSKYKPKWKKKIVCIGAFRDKEELDLIKTLGTKLLLTRYYIVAPSIMCEMNVNWSRRNKLKLLKPAIIALWLRWRFHIITKFEKWVDHDMLSEYMRDSVISLIHRKKILNSGNLPLGFLFSNIVIGPDDGNVGIILKQRNNPVFDPNKTETLVKAVKDAISLEKKELGINNHKYAVDNWSTNKIAEMHYLCYYKLLNR